MLLCCLFICLTCNREDEAKGDGFPSFCGNKRGCSNFILRGRQVIQVTALRTCSRWGQGSRRAWWRSSPTRWTFSSPSSQTRCWFTQYANRDDDWIWSRFMWQLEWEYDMIWYDMIRTSYAMLYDDVVMEYTQHSTNIQHKALSARSTSIWRKVATKNGLRLCAAGLRPFFSPTFFSPTSFAIYADAILSWGLFRNLNLNLNFL